VNGGYAASKTASRHLFYMRVKMEFNGRHGRGSVYLLVALLFWVLFLVWGPGKVRR
jgi:hypothetical protein